MEKKLRYEKRPWGDYQVLHEESESGFQVKRITVLAGHRLSLQSHARRSEIWTIVSGQAEATVGEKVHVLKPGDMIKIERGAKHRMANPGTVDLIFVEVQLGEYLGEDDIKRFEDDYQRE